MDHDKLLKSWLREESQPFTGWDFSYLQGRMIEGEPPWAYESRAAELLQNSTSVLDLDTGGGERLLDLRADWPPKVVSTEGYPPNIELATQRLSPYGVRIVPAQLTASDPLPLADGEFDLILNRHGAINPSEIARTLAPGGIFLTEQVHELWAFDLVQAFGLSAPTHSGTPEEYSSLFTTMGMEIVNVSDWRGQLLFTDVGAIVYYLKAIPWVVPGFTVNNHTEYLFALQESVEAGEALTFTAATYLLEARRPVEQ